MQTVNQLRQQQDTCVVLPLEGRVPHLNLLSKGKKKSEMNKLVSVKSIFLKRSHFTESLRSLKLLQQLRMTKQTLGNEQKQRESLKRSNKWETFSSRIYPRTTLRRILKEDLKMKPYKIQLHQPLRHVNCERRFEFANDVLERLQNGTINLARIWWSDEAHLDLSGHVNKQNWRHWGTQNPHLAIIRPLTLNG